VLPQLERHDHRRGHDVRRERRRDPRGRVRHRLRELRGELVPYARRSGDHPRPWLYHREHKDILSDPTDTPAGASSGQVEFHFVVNVKAPSPQYNGPLLLVATTQ